MDMVEFWTLCSTNNINIDKSWIETFERYAKELKYWNEKVNLISRKDEENILDRHILHSLSICKYFEFKPKANVLDVGTGGGLPGIPIKIANPDIRIDLIDSITKKAKITEMLASHTGLRNIQVFNGRVEDHLTKSKKNYDVIIARAVTRTISILDWTIGSLKKDGAYVLLKGGDLTEEIAEAKQKYPKLQYQLINIDFLGYDYFKEQEKKILIIESF